MRPLIDGGLSTSAADVEITPLLGTLAAQDFYLWNGTNTLLKFRHAHSLLDLFDVR